MSVQSEMTALADQVRRLSGETGTLGISAMTTALAGVTAGGGSGATIQRTTGTFNTGSSGDAVVTCGFMPDIIFIQGQMEDGVYPISAAMVFPEETRYAVGTSYWPAILLIPEDTSIYAFLEFYFKQTSTGFNAEVWGTDYSWEYAKLTNTEFDYVAIKYTQEPEQTENGIVQTGSILSITSGVTATQTGTVLALA